MKTYYLDKDFRVHIQNSSPDWLPWVDETDTFNGKCHAYIEGYRIIPKGESWTAPDGTTYIGETVFPAVDYNMLLGFQSNYEELKFYIDNK